MNLNVKLLSLVFVLFAGFYLSSCASDSDSSNVKEEAAESVTSATNNATSSLNTATSGNTATSATAPTGPTTSIKFDKSTHDFGTLTAGEKATYKYTFTNTGTEPLIISNVKASCGCTTPSYSKEPVAPGETGFINVQYSASGSGSVTKNVTITANTKPAKTMIYLKANVVKK